MLLYYITDRTQFPGDERARRKHLLEKVAEAARVGVEYIQLREKDLSARELESLARQALAKLATGDRRLPTRVLINSRIDVALAVGAHGVHLPAGDLAASDARSIWEKANRNVKHETRNCIVAVSCHSLDDVRAAESHGADFAVFGPVFEKRGEPGREQGLEALRKVCHRGVPPDRKTESVATGAMPVLALGGITLENAPACIAAGAAGIAAIRLFQENDIAAVVRQLRTP